MPNENRKYIGKEADGNELFAGDVVKIIEHYMSNPDVVGEHRTITGDDLLFPPPAGLQAILGDGFFDVVDDEGTHSALHCATCVKVTSN